MKKIKSYGRKMLAFFMVHFTIIIFYVLSFPWNGSDLSKTAIVPCLGAMVLNAMAYIGGNVWNTYVKSTHFQPDLVGK